MQFFPSHTRAQSEPPSEPQRRHRLQQALGLLMAGLAGPLWARGYEGQQFEERLQLGGQALQLNGVGMRAVAVLKGYLAALYIARPANSPSAIYAMPGPKRIEMRVLVNVSTEELIKAINKSMQRNCTEAERAAVGDQLAGCIAQLRAVARVKEKDVLTMDYLPERGTLLSVNGRSLGAALSGPEFYVALLKIFLGDRPVDKSLKAGLLGAPAA